MGVCSLQLLYIGAADTGMVHHRLRVINPYPAIGLLLIGYGCLPGFIYPPCWKVLFKTHASEFNLQLLYTDTANISMLHHGLRVINP